MFVLMLVPLHSPLHSSRLWVRAGTATTYARSTPDYGPALARHTVQAPCRWPGRHPVEARKRKKGPPRDPFMDRGAGHRVELAGIEPASGTVRMRVSTCRRIHPSPVVYSAGSAAEVDLKCGVAAPRAPPLPSWSLIVGLPLPVVLDIPNRFAGRR